MTLSPNPVRVSAASFMRRKDSRVLLPLAVADVGLAAASFVYLGARASEREAREERLDNIVARAEAAITTRFATYEDALRAGSALLASSENVTSEEWVSFAEAIDLPRYHPVLNGIGAIFPVAAASREAFEADSRANIDPAFSIRQMQGGPVTGDLLVITYIEPLEGNQSARGLDIGSHPASRAAAERARDSGQTTVTNAVVLGPDDASRPGFLILMPMYRAGSARSTVQERNDAFSGIVYAPFFAERFFEVVLEQFADDVDVRVLQVDGGSDDVRLYGAASAFDEARALPLDLGGDRFRLEFDEDSFARGVSNAPWAAASVIIATALAATIIGWVQNGSARAWARARLAERVAEERTQVVNLASHELRNPLSVLTLSAEMLESRALELDDEELREAASAARIAAGRAEALVAELLDLGRIDAGRLKIATATVDVEETLHAVCDLTFAHWGKRPLVVEWSRDVGRAVMTDGARLAIILRNMIDNAVKYSGRESPISVFIARRGPGAVTVTVSDEGPGVGEADRALIFERFSRAERTADIGGIGIGLNLSRELARRLGGDLELVEGVTRGASFRLTLPAPAGGAAPEPDVV